MPILLWTIPVYAVLSTLIHYQLQLRGLMPLASPLEAFGLAWISAGLLFGLVEYLAWAWPLVERHWREALAEIDQPAITMVPTMEVEK